MLQSLETGPRLPLLLSFGDGEEDISSMGTWDKGPQLPSYLTPLGLIIVKVMILPSAGSHRFLELIHPQLGPA